MLCAAASVNLEATLYAMRRAMALIDFGDSVIFTDDTALVAGPGIRIEIIPRITSSSDYSDFMLGKLVDHVLKNHCLVVQWDGFPTHPENWDPAFLQYDYIGAPWPQFTDGHDVGNGGFSLRSRRLMELCRLPQFLPSHPEDVAICRLNRPLLESAGMRFADSATASRFSRERTGSWSETFGFHGVFNMVEALGQEQFWDLYQNLDDRTTIWRDTAIAAQMMSGRHGTRRAIAIRLSQILSWLSARFKF